MIFVWDGDGTQWSRNGAIHLKRGPVFWTPTTTLQGFPLYIEQLLQLNSINT